MQKNRRRVIRFGSVKDSQDTFLMKNAYNDGIIKNDTVIIESSSGNFGIVLLECAKNKRQFFYMRGRSQHNRVK